MSREHRQDVVALNLGDVQAQVGGAKIRGNVTGLALIQVAGEDLDLSGATIDTSSIRRSFLPGFRAVEASMEDVSLADNCMPDATLDGSRLVRTSVAKSLMPGSSLVRVVAPYLNGQKTNLRYSDLSDANLEGFFGNEGDTRDVTVTPQTSMRRANLADASRDRDALQPHQIEGAVLGHGGPSEGNLRASERKSTAAQIAKAPRVLGGEGGGLDR